MSGAHLVDAFLEMMSAERGAAKNTIEAYRRDLSDYSGWLARKSADPKDASREQVVGYLAYLDGQGLSASSSSSWCWSGSPMGRCSASSPWSIRAKRT